MRETTHEFCVVNVLAFGGSFTVVPGYKKEKEDSGSRGTGRRKKTCYTRMAMMARTRVDWVVGLWMEMMMMVADFI